MCGHLTGADGDLTHLQGSWVYRYCMRRYYSNISPSFMATGRKGPQLSGLYLNIGHAAAELCYTTQVARNPANGP
jgi:hypothetical protein